MSFDAENTQNDLVLNTNRDSLSPNVEATDYGLNPSADEFKRESQLGSISEMPLELTETLPLAENDAHQLVFISSAVEDSQTLMDNISGATEVILLDSSQDELVQISQQLSNYQDLDAVHIVSHGESGQLSFGDTKLNSDTLPEYVHLLEDWGNSLSAEADLLLYGCDVSSGESGNAFIQQVSQITDADVAASLDDTGISGDWELETSVGEIEATSVFDDAIESAYQHDLDAFGSVSESLGGGGGGSEDNSANVGGGGDVNIGLNNDLDGDDDDNDEDNNEGSDVSFTGDQYFNEDFYLEQNPDVADAGVDPVKHYDEFGWKEGRDPNKYFDTSFYLEQNPDVADAGINPFEHYYENADSDGITRYPNQDFRTIGTSSDAIIISASDLSSVDIGAINSFADNVKTENPELAALPVVVIPIVYALAKGVAVTAISLELAKRVNNIQELIRESTTYTLSTDDGGIDSSIPPFDTGEIIKVEQESFPNGDRFIENILDGQFEFPDGDVLFTDNFLSINSGDSNIVNNDDFWDDPLLGDTVLPPISDVSDEAEIIANNDHSFDKHKEQFPDVETREDFAQKIDRVRNSKDTISKDLPRGRTGYWQGTTGTLVVTDPNNPNGGTMYKPDNGKDAYDALEE